MGVGGAGDKKKKMDNEVGGWKKKGVQKKRKVSKKN